MTLGSHQTTVGKSQVHITPRWIIDALGPFDLDPCAADPRPWDCAHVNLTESMDGLRHDWDRFPGLAWLNPPFDRYSVAAWVDRLSLRNGGGIALLHARTETDWFQPCWRRASAILFMDRRISFCRPDGSTQPANSGAPPVLIAFGPVARFHLERSGIPGALVIGWRWNTTKTELAHVTEGYVEPRP